MKKKKTVLTVLIFLILALVIGLGVYFLPKLTLIRALDAAISQWTERYEASPISMLAEHLDADGQYALQLEASTSNDVAGEITYSMEAQTDGTTNQFYASGTASVGGIDLEISIYMDKSFIALSSQELLDGVYYGVTYDSFPADIRSIPLLSLAAGEELLAEWEESVAGLQATMGMDYTMPEMPDLSGISLDAVEKLALLLPAKISQEEITVGEQTLECRCFTYSADGDLAGEILHYLMESGENPSISISFYVYDGQLVYVSLTGSTGESSDQYVVELPASGDALTLRGELKENGEDSEFAITVTSAQSDGYSYESFAYCDDFEGTGETTAFSYRWDADTGEMVIDWDTPITLYLSEEGEGLQLATEDVGLLIALMAGDSSQQDSDPISCTVTLTQGSGIDTPEYKNLGTWTLADFLTLIGNVGALFGLSFSFSG